MVAVAAIKGEVFEGLGSALAKNQEWWCGLQRVESGLGPLRPILKGIEFDLSGFKRQMQMGLTD